MSAISASTTNHSPVIFECERLTLKSILSPCKGNRSRGVFACIGCVGAVSVKGDLMSKAFCKVEGCNKLVQKQGMCKAHLHGTPSRLAPAVKAAAVKPLPVVSAQESVLVDEMKVVFEELTDVRTALIRTFKTGATRTHGSKPEYAGYLSPRVLSAFGRYMFEHQVQADGSIRESRNWQKGIPQESYMQSMFRHFMEVWTHYENSRGDAVYTEEFETEMITALMALLFNVQGMAHELIGGRQ